MLGFVSSALDGVHYAIGVNAATLSGAVDIVVVAEKSHGGDVTLRSTPFHVRFGKLQILRSAGAEVAITVNVERAALRMTLGHAGEAFFAEPKTVAAVPQIGEMAGVHRAPEVAASVPSLLSQSTPALAPLPEEMTNEAPSEPSVNVPTRSASDGRLGTVSVSASADEAATLEWEWGQLPRPAKQDATTVKPREKAENKWGALAEAVMQSVRGESKEQLQLSLCATFLGKISCDDKKAVDRAFAEHRVTWAQFSSSPQMLSSPELMFRVGLHVVPWTVAAPLVSGVVFFGKCLDEKVMEHLESSQACPFPDAPVKANLASPSDSAADMGPPSSPSSWSRYKSWIWKEKNVNQEKSGGRGRSNSAAIPTEDDSNSYYFDDAEGGNKLSAQDPTASAPPRNAVAPVLPETLVKSLVPTSDELKSLNLKPGANQVVFSVETGLRGKQSLSCQLFLWDADVPIVISDVDGTITRSDVPGMFLPYVGKDWSQKGVTDLFSRIQNNGYNILYLTARSIGQANSTRGFISTLIQGNSRLPNGPVFMSPDRLIHALSREVVERRPEEFKIQCLESLKRIYPTDFNPFSAGFGNRPSDVSSYLAVGIPELRIFVINPLGTVTTANITYKKTYTDLSVLANDMFPAKRDDTTYNDALFWSVPILNL